MAEGILVIIENNGEQVNRLAWEALTGAQTFAAEVGQPVYAAVPGKGVTGLADEVAGKKLDKVYVLEDDKLQNYTPDGYAAALQQLINHVQPAYVFWGHTYQVRDYAPKLATVFGKVMLSDVIGYRMEDGKPVFVRQMFAGKFNADFTFEGDAPYFVSFQAGTFSADELQDGKAEVETFALDLSSVEIRTEVLDIFQGVKQEVDLSKAEVIVSAGRGLKEKDNLKLVFELAEALGGEVAASRPVCDDGWLPVDRQIGSSGQTVAPKLYLAVGISGAIQHVVGMKGSKYIVAINKDPHAPIFEIADVGVVADLFEVVPELTRAIKEAKGA
ncbi:MAG: electron transfer flavoprotein subunit alpha/FixB family protein [candidate division KSB1 bacterium]|nr:electron transfer flavoprotein subunit alpha/FixB family protein [candidate division KSB1 bacterium]